jgi:release factor glutamine methyltransferase
VTARALLRVVTERLAAAGLPSPQADARWLVRHVLGWSAARLTLDGDRPLPADRVAAVERLADRRAAHEPLQLLLGSTAFRGHHLSLRPGVFVPRPETELLVDLAIEPAPAAGVVVEPCTGSGAIACAVAVEHPGATVVATDVDPAAVALARHNAALLGAAVDVRCGDLLAPVPRRLHGRVDVLVANPPYLAAAELAALPEDVARWDPVGALVSGPTGHEASDALIAAAGAWLAPGGRLALELDERRVADAAARARAAGLVEVREATDLAGRPRFLLARRPHAGRPASMTRAAAAPRRGA